VLCHNRLIDVGHLPGELQAARHDAQAGPAATSRLQWAEADAIRVAIARAGGVLGRAADELCINRTTLWRKMKRYGLTADPGERAPAPDRGRRG
jgi:transcriptional regulator of acetoin/glycerol metabolism